MICAIVLAAGRSQRMGTQKLLLPLDGKPVIARIVDELQRSPLQQTIVVTGNDGEKVRRALAGRDVVFVRNPNGSGDMLSSIRCGLRAAPSECGAVLVVLGDQPNLSSRLATQIITKFKSSGRGIVLPMHGGHRGHPVLIAARFRDELLNRHDDVGLRGLLDAHPGEILGQEVPGDEDLHDMDTQADYQRQLTRTRPRTAQA